jgi:hypothetical protein
MKRSSRPEGRTGRPLPTQSGRPEPAEISMLISIDSGSVARILRGRYTLLTADHW